MEVQKKSRKVYRDPIGKVARGSIIHESGLIEKEPKTLRGHAADCRNRLLDTKIGDVEDGLSLSCAHDAMGCNIRFDGPSQETHDASRVFHEPKGFYSRMIGCSFGLRDRAQHT
jgi:hypothetical protein